MTCLLLVDKEQIDRPAGQHDERSDGLGGVEAKAAAGDEANGDCSCICPAVAEAECGPPASGPKRNKLAGIPVHRKRTGRKGSGHPSPRRWRYRRWGWTAAVLRPRALMSDDCNRGRTIRDDGGSPWRTTTPGAPPKAHSRGSSRDGRPRSTAAAILTVHDRLAVPANRATQRRGRWLQPCGSRRSPGRVHPQRGKPLSIGAAGGADDSPGVDTSAVRAGYW